MTTSGNRKPVPRSILIFGAASHIGGPMARFLAREAPHIRLRLVSSRKEGCAALANEFPNAEVVSADYHDLPSMEAAVAGMEGIFFISNGRINEDLATRNFIAAANKSGSAVHIVRFVGFEPEANLRRRTPKMVQGHHLAKKLLDASDLPVTYLNSGASFMDNLFWMKPGLVRDRKLIWADRLVPFIDPRDLGEVAARLLLSDNHRHLYQLHTMNNGHDLLRHSDIARMLSEISGEKISFDGSKEGFMTSPNVPPAHIRPLLWEFFEYEEQVEVVWALNDFAQRILGRKPVTMEQWLKEHSARLLA